MSGRTGSRAQLSLNSGSKNPQPGANGNTEQQQSQQTNQLKKMGEAYVGLKKIDANLQNPKELDKIKKKQEQTQNPAPKQQNTSKIPQSTLKNQQASTSVSATASNSSESIKKPAKNEDKEKVQNGTERSHGSSTEQKSQEYKNGKDVEEKKREIKEKKQESMGEKPEVEAIIKETLPEKKEAVVVGSASEKSNGETPSPSTNNSPVPTKISGEKRTPVRTSQRAAAAAAAVAVAIAANTELDIKTDDNRNDKQESENSKQKNDGDSTDVIHISSGESTKKDPEISSIIAPPSATSTPGKSYLPKFTHKEAKEPKSDIPLTMSDLCVPRSLSQISGRRPIREYTPTKYTGGDGGLQYRGSFRHLNTDFNDSAYTNTSMNVTVGSERQNNSTFSFFLGFGRRKRDRGGSPHSQSAVESENDLETSPAKRSRLDLHNFFSAVSSPLTNLRSRFSKASICSPSVNKNSDEDEHQVEVQNVSGVVADDEALNGETSDADVSMASEANADQTEEQTKDSGDTVKISSDDKEKSQGGVTGEDITAPAMSGEEITVQEVAIKKSNCAVM